MIYGALTKPPRFLSVDEVMILHATSIELHGGSHGIRDEGLLRSACAMPEQGFAGEFAHTVPFGMASAYAFHLCKNHPFVDGNKRTAFVACVSFLQMNGWEMQAPDETAWEQIVAIAENRLDKVGMEAWLVQNCRPRPSIELRDFICGLTPNDIAQKANELSAGGAQERGASWDEATRSIPVIADFAAGYKRWLDEGKEREAGELYAYANMLVMLYRLAEDQGYEW